MARTTGSDGEKTEAAIREAAVSLMARYGYEAVSMRQLAAEVGVQAAALYRYFPTKEDLLFTLMREHMEKLIAAWDACAAGDGRSGGPARRLRRQPHPLPRRAPAFDACLEHGAAQPVARAPDRASCGCAQPTRRNLRQILRDGADSGVFAIDDTGADRHGDHPDDHRRDRLVPAGRAAFRRGSDRNLSCNDDAPCRCGEDAREERHVHEHA